MPPRLAVALRGEGHDAVHVVELGMGSLRDSDVFARSAAESRILITFDLDFGDILAASQSRQVSVVLFRLRAMVFGSVRRRLAATLAAASPALEEGAIVIVEDARIRIRRLPIGS